jgi:hypothetical protein
MKHWDAFVSHASEDKESVAIPLTTALKGAGLRVWLDRAELKIGDSLRQKIDQGLAQSRFGILIVSKNFLSKHWPQQELNGLMALEEPGHTVILPVWHDIDKTLLKQYSPMLADRVAANTADGMDRVVRAIIDVVLAPGSGSPSEIEPGPGIRLARLLQDGADKGTITAFLRAHPAILERAGVAERQSTLIWSTNVAIPATVASIAPDLCIGTLWPTRGRRVWQVLLFEDPSRSLFRASGTPLDSLTQAIARIDGFRGWVAHHLADARLAFTDIAPNFFGTIVAGRRQDNAESAEWLAALNDSLIGTRVRSYDWLIEAAH